MKFSIVAVILILNACIVESLVQLIQKNVVIYDQYGDPIDFSFIGGKFSIWCDVNRCFGDNPVQVVSEKGVVVASVKCQPALAINVTIDEETELGHYKCQYNGEKSSDSFYFHYHTCSPEYTYDLKEAECIGKTTPICVVTKEYPNGKCHGYVIECFNYGYTEYDLPGPKLCPASQTSFCHSIRKNVSLQDLLSQYDRRLSCDKPGDVFRFVYGGKPLHLNQYFFITKIYEIKVAISSKELGNPLYAQLECVFKLTNGSQLPGIKKDVTRPSEYLIKFTQEFLESEFLEAKLYCKLANKKQILAEAWVIAVVIHYPKFKDDTCEVKSQHPGVRYIANQAETTKYPDTVECHVKIYYTSQFPYAVYSIVRTTINPKSVDRTVAQILAGVGAAMVLVVIILVFICIFCKKRRQSDRRKHTGMAREGIQSGNSLQNRDSSQSSPRR